MVKGDVVQISFKIFCYLVAYVKTKITAYIQYVQLKSKLTLQCWCLSGQKGEMLKVITLQK